MADVRYQFFLSSTFEDLRRERQQVIEAVLELGHIPVGMEVFPSADETPWDIIRKTIEQSDYYIVLSAGRYGTCDQTGLSFTEREFDLAVELGVPIIGFVAEKPFDRLEAHRDDDSEKRRKLVAFHQKIRSRHVRTWATVDELNLRASKAVIHATQNYPRVGWVRADQAKSLNDFRQVEALREELGAKEAEIERLEQELDDAEQIIQQTIISGEDIQPDLLASGSDIVRIPVKYTIDSVRHDHDIETTWDQLFSVIAPKLFNSRVRRGYSGKFDFEKDLASFLKEIIQISSSQAQIRINPRFVDSILFQFKQTGLMMLEPDARGEATWTLTPRGQAHMTKLVVTFRAPA